MDKKLEILKTALLRGELYEYMVGQKDYGYVSPYADMPTYPADVFSSIVSYYNETKDKSIWPYFEASLVDISKDKAYCWFSLYYLAEYFRYSRRVRAVDLKNISEVIVENIVGNKSYLVHDHKWIGQDYPNGIWGDVKRMIDNINEENEVNLRI